jgi:hypothetical protein
MKKCFFLFVPAILFVCFDCIGQSVVENEIYTDVYSVFVSGKDIYAVGNLCTDGTSVTDVPMLWKNGQAQKIGNMGNFNRATSVFVLGNDVYISISETDSVPENYHDNDSDELLLDDVELVEDIELSVSGEEVETNYNPRALLWKNGERQLLWNGVAECVCVVEKDIYVVGEKDKQPVLWKNGNLQVLASSGSATSIVVHGKDVYIVGYLGSIFNGESVIWKNGEMTNLGRGLAHSVHITDNGDVYVAGTINMNNAALWKNGELWWTESFYSSNAYSMTMTDDGTIIISGNTWVPSSGWDAALWINGSYFGVDDKMRYQANTTIADGDDVYIGGDGKGSLWPVWKFNRKTEFDADKLKRVEK